MVILSDGMGLMDDLRIDREPFEDKSNLSGEEQEYAYKGVCLSFFQADDTCKVRIYDDEKNSAGVVAFYDRKKELKFSEYESGRLKKSGGDPHSQLSGRNPHSLVLLKIPYL